MVMRRSRTLRTPLLVAAAGAVVVAGLVGPAVPSACARSSASGSAWSAVRLLNAVVKIAPPTAKRPFSWLVVQLEVDNSLPVPVELLQVRLELSAPAGLPLSRLRHVRGPVAASSRQRVELAERVPGTWSRGPLPSVQIALVDFGVRGELTPRQLLEMTRRGPAEQRVARRLAHDAPGTMALAAARDRELDLQLFRLGLETHDDQAGALHDRLQADAPRAVVEAARLAEAIRLQVEASRAEKLPDPDVGRALFGLAWRGSHAARDVLCSVTSSGQQPAASNLYVLVDNLTANRAAMRQVARDCLRTLTDAGTRIDPDGRPPHLPQLSLVQHLLLGRWPELGAHLQCGWLGGLTANTKLTLEQCASFEVPLERIVAMIAQVVELERERRLARKEAFIRQATRANLEGRPRDALRTLDDFLHDLPEENGPTCVQLRAHAITGLIEQGAALEALSALRCVSFVDGPLAQVFRRQHSAANRQLALAQLRAGHLDQAQQHLQWALIHGDPAELRPLQIDLAAAQVRHALATGDGFLAHQALASLEKLDGGLHRQLQRRVFWASYGGLLGMGAGVLLLVLLAGVASVRQRLLVLRRLVGADKAESGPAMAHPYR
jgi:hypothetical protein